jgi:hypothetical protein
MLTFDDLMNLESLPWSCVENQDEVGPILFRFRQFDPMFQRAEFPQRLNIFWRMRQPTDHGLPTQSEFQETRDFEDRLVSAVESDTHSILTLVLVGKNMKEWVFQTPDPQAFLERLTNMPQEEERYPIEILHTEDPTWDYFDRVIGDLKQ